MTHNPAVFTVHSGYNVYPQHAPRVVYTHVFERTCRPHPDDLHFENRDLIRYRRATCPRRVAIAT